MPCALCNASRVESSIDVCQPCHDSLFRRVEATDVGLSEAIAVEDAAYAAASAAQAAAKERAPAGEATCSFCGLARKEVKRLLTGIGATYICDGCVELCRRILDSEG